MTVPHATGVIGDVIAVICATISAINVFHGMTGVLVDFQFHDFVGTIAGLMAITYYLYHFVQWLWRSFKGT